MYNTMLSPLIRITQKNDVINGDLSSVSFLKGWVLSSMFLLLVVLIGPLWMPSWLIFLLEVPVLLRMIAEDRSSVSWIIFWCLFIDVFPHLSSLILGKILVHRTILLLEHIVDYGPFPFQLFHPWYGIDGFEDIVDYGPFLLQCFFITSGLNKEPSWVCSFYSFVLSCQTTT